MKNSHFIIPLNILAHLVIINSTLTVFTSSTFKEPGNMLFLNISWLVIVFALRFYPENRQERFETKVNKMFQQYLVFSLAYFAYFGFNRQANFLPEFQVYVLLILFFLLSLYRWVFYFMIGKYRAVGGNFVKVVVVGKDRNLEKLQEVFEQRDLGYRFCGYFDNKIHECSSYLGDVDSCYEYTLRNGIDEIYCIASGLTNDEIKKLIDFADNNLKKLKIIPDNKEVFSRGMSVEHYDTVPVINLRQMPLENGYGVIAKRIFDVFFSSIIILAVLSWLTPLLFILIKLESRGPLFFIQKRPGINKTQFWCYKFRSMAAGNNSEEPGKKNDPRVTKIGKFLRKTSLDELPQFFNVFLGDMSVVGPRPHMLWQNETYKTSVDKFLVRQYVKPGITGLAQVKGYRGEIIEKADIVNRVRMDIFYLEKWSFYLDLQIIYFTFLNAIKGEEKAY